jgi:hypothetical protein
MKILTKKFSTNEQKEANDFFLKMKKKGYSGWVETAYYRNYKDIMVYYWQLEKFKVGDKGKINKEKAKAWSQTGLWNTIKYVDEVGEVVKVKPYTGGIYTITLKMANGTKVEAMSNYVDKIKSSMGEGMIKLKDLLVEKTIKVGDKIRITTACTKGVKS